MMGTPVSPTGQGYIDVLGIWSTNQVAGWKLVTHTVHANQGKIFAQIWNVRRMSHTSLQPNSSQQFSASTHRIPSNSKSMLFLYHGNGTRGPAEQSPARALSYDEIPLIIRDF